MKKLILFAAALMLAWMMLAAFPSESALRAKTTVGDDGWYYIDISSTDTLGTNKYENVDVAVPADYWWQLDADGTTNTVLALRGIMECLNPAANDSIRAGIQFGITGGARWLSAISVGNDNWALNYNEVKQITGLQVATTGGAGPLMRIKTYSAGADNVIAPHWRLAFIKAPGR